MEEILGWDPDDIVGTTVISIDELSEPARLYRDVLAGIEKIGRTEFTAQHRNGTWRSSVRVRARLSTPVTRWLEL